MAETEADFVGDQGLNGYIKMVRVVRVFMFGM